jgi:ubiquitin-small subunit ribosomal protein S27Ae
MQLFVKTLTGATVTVVVEASNTVDDLKQQVAEKTGVAVEEIVLIHGLSVLDDQSTFEALGLEDESTINMVLSLEGGKKKRKKKVYTKPKKIGHKHKKRPKAILEYFNVDNTGKITKLKIECEKCPPGKYKVQLIAALCAVVVVI